MEELIRMMALAAERTASAIRYAIEENYLEGAGKKIALQLAMTSLPAELSGLNLEFIGDNWLEDLCPDIAASIALIERDRDGNVIRCATAPVSPWDQRAVVAGEEGVYILNQEGFSPIREVNPILLEFPPRVYLFGQKSTPYWAAMNSVIGEMNRRGMRTQNDCGPFYGLMSWFSNFNCRREVITPRNVVYIEPNNKPKNDVMAFMIHCLNQSLSGNQFVIADMSGRPALTGGKFPKGPDGTYDSVGFIIAPVAESYVKVMAVLREAVLNEPAFASSVDSRMTRLRQELLSWQGRE